MTTLTTNMTSTAPNMEIIINNITKMTTEAMSTMMSPTTSMTKITTSATTTASTTTTTSETSQSVVSGRNDIVSELRPDVGEFGDFQDYEYCPEGSWAYGFRQRVEFFQFTRDDTALNAIRLHCRKHDGTITGNISSFEGYWGSWSNSAYCGDVNGVYMFYAAFKIEDYRGPSIDDTSANDFRSQCWNGTVVSNNALHASNGNMFGTWKRSDACNKGSAICGISSKFDKPQGEGYDDTAMNGAFFKCCSL
ncbi:unnamed protein product [Rotaria socialis]